MSISIAENGVGVSVLTGVNVSVGVSVGVGVAVFRTTVGVIVNGSVTMIGVVVTIAGVREGMGVQTGNGWG